MSTTSNPDGELTPLRFQDPDGRYVGWRVRFGEWTLTPGSALATRPVIDVSGTVVAEQRAVLRPAGVRASAAYDPLENEIRIGVRLARQFPGPYPRELARFIGYDADDEVPFALFAPATGEPVTAYAGELGSEQQSAFATSLYQGLLALSNAGIVHGGLRPHTVFWDRRAAQIRDLTTAMVIGESRPGAVVVKGDDIRDAAAVIYHAVTERPFPPRGAPNLAGRELLRRWFEGVFVEQAYARPDAEEMLRRLGATASVPAPAPLLGDGFDDGIRVFQHALARKRESLGPPRGVPHKSAPSRRQRRRWSWDMVALGVTTALVLASLVLTAVWVVW